MEITNETKAKVFAQYLGQTCTTITRKTQGEGLPSKYLKGELKEIDLGMASNCIGLLLEDEIDFSNHTNYTPDQSKLILKPLSAITDEDAIAACEAGFPFAFMGNNTKGKWKVSRGDNKNGFLTIKTTHSYFAFEMDTEGCPLINMYDDNETTNTFCNEFAYQYLQSKGYDLPNYLLGGQTLQQAGLAVYENELTTTK